MPEHDFLNYSLFITFFLHLIAGPITHHREMLDQFREPANFRPRLDNIAVGATLFLLFSPASLLDNARRVKDRRANKVELDPLVFTAYGDGPLNTADSHLGLVYGKPEPLDAVCCQALEFLAQRLQKEGRRFTAISPPPASRLEGPGRCQWCIHQRLRRQDGQGAENHRCTLLER